MIYTNMGVNVILILILFDEYLSVRKKPRGAINGFNFELPKMTSPGSNMDDRNDKNQTAGFCRKKELGF